MIDPRFVDTIRDRIQPLRPTPTNVEPRFAAIDGIRAVLFDVYGTLLISASGDVGLDSGLEKTESLQETLKLFDLHLDCSLSEAIEVFEASVREDHLQAKTRGIKYPEVDIVEVWCKSLAKLVSPPVDFDFERFAFEYESRINPVWPMPAADTTLDTLRSMELVLGIVSNAQFFTPILMEALFGKSLSELGFSNDLSYFSYEHRQAKPGTYLFELAKRRLDSQGIIAEHVLYVGNDLLNDVAAAQSVGFRTVLFAGDARSLRWREGDARVDDVEPDAIISDLSQLANCLSGYKSIRR